MSLPASPSSSPSTSTTTLSTPANLKNAIGLKFFANSTNISGKLLKFLATAFASLDYFALAFNLFIGTPLAAFATTSLRSLWFNNQVGNSHLFDNIAFVANMTSLEDVALVQ